MSTTWIAFGIALVAVTGVVLSLAGLSLLSGALEFLFGKPKFKLLKSLRGDTGLAFSFRWNAAKEPAKLDVFKLRLFNPFGKPVQMEVARNFEPASSSFTKDLDLGPGYRSILNAKGIDNARVTLEVSSSKDGIDYQYEMKGSKFKSLLRNANKTIDDVNGDTGQEAKQPSFGIQPRDMIADTVPGKGAQVAIPTNPAFSKYFVGAGGGAAAGEAAEAKENFAVKKVWIADGCIVCNACEDIYPEVFDVQADTCVIRPGAPLDDGLRIQEASDACPVEVIKYDVA